MTRDKMNHIEEMYLIYRTIPRVARLSRILECFEKHGTNWMTHDESLESSLPFLIKKVLVQFVEGITEENEDTVDPTVKSYSPIGVELDYAEK